eukprot:sb/3470542/
MNKEVQWQPDVIMVDGNGRLHQKQFGLACHAGVVTGIPCIGVAKDLIQFETISRDNIKDELQTLKSSGDWFPLKLNGVVLGCALKPERVPRILSTFRRVMVLPWIPQGRLSWQPLRSSGYLSQRDLQTSCRERKSGRIRRSEMGKFNVMGPLIKTGIAMGPLIMARRVMDIRVMVENLMKEPNMKEGNRKDAVEGLTGANSSA